MNVYIVIVEAPGHEAQSLQVQANSAEEARGIVGRIITPGVLILNVMRGGESK